MKTELLAPAGDIEAGYAALYYGADAVYLGLQQFSARATAVNFDENGLNAFTAYAHSLGRKVYVTINTLLQDNELPDLIKTLDICSNCGVDALIIQDLGVARVVKSCYPELEMHASTQMAVHNKEGALALQKAGFSRVVLARELTLNEIKEIAALPNLETEAFIHGALCYSYSGLCLFSSMESGRSANRGKCLYPCRSCFKGEQGEKHYFSMKDMALADDVLKMSVTSLKIEGRKKSALYVAAVTDFYRKILDGEGADAVKAENIRQIFSRPWCKFHFNGKDKKVVDPDFVGHRGLPIGQVELVKGRKIQFKTNHFVAKHDGIQFDVEGQDKPWGFSLQKLKVSGKEVFEAHVGDVVEISLPPAAPCLQKGMMVYLASSSQVKGAYRYDKPKDGAFVKKYPLEVCVKITPDDICAKVGDVFVTQDGHFETASSPEQVEQAVRKAFDKTGNTVWKLMSLKIENLQNLFVPMSVLNDLRRKLYEKLVPELKHGNLPDISPVSSKFEKTKWIVKTDDLSVLEEIDLEQVDEIVYLLGDGLDYKQLRQFPKNKLRIALPAVCRKTKMSEMRSNIENLLAGGFKKWEIGNYWGLDVLPDKGVDLSFDSSIYTMNSQAAAMAAEMGGVRITLPLEDTLDNMKKLVKTASVPTVMVVYQDVPLFTSAVCLRSNECKDCPRGKKWLTLRKGNVEYQALSENCQIMLFRDEPLCLTEQARDIQPSFFRVDFVHKKYAPREAKEIFEAVTRFQKIEKSFQGNILRKNL